FERVIQIGWITIHCVQPITLDADAAHSLAIFVKRQPSRIGRETQRQSRLFDVRTRKRRKLHAVKRTARAKIYARRKMFLDNEAGSARRKRVSTRAERSEEHTSELQSPDH